jgi:hypothetical protein
MLTFLFRDACRRAARQSHAAARRPFVPRLEVLEDKSLLSTLTVTNLADSGAGSLRGQLAAAAPGDTIDFASELSGTIALGSDLTLDRNVTVMGNLDAAGNPLVTLTRSGRDWSTDLIVNPGVTASVSGLTLTGASEHAVFNRGSLTLSRVVVTGNLIGEHDPSRHSAGPVYNAGATLVVQDSRITNNRVQTWGYTYTLDGGGGGIWNAAGTLTVANSTVANNTVWQFGTAATVGGGIANLGGTATITGSTITGNDAHYGAGVYSSGSGTLTVSASLISGNGAPAVFVAGLLGGGIYVEGNGTATITDSTVSGNAALGAGGGIYARGAALALLNSTVANNQAGGDGGGPAQGGGIFVDWRSAVTVINSTIAGNTARNGYSTYGGGIYVRSGFPPGPASTLALLNSTVANNHTDGAGGGLWVSAARTEVRLANTLVAGNTAATGGPDVTGPVLPTSAYNLIGDGSGLSGISHGENGNQIGTATSPIDPRLGPLQDNGGPTQTMALLPGSPALNAGDPDQLGLADQRGVVRSGGVNIGAYQASASAFVLTAPDTVTAGTPFDLTVTAVDVFGQTALGYTGTVTFSTTDPDPGVVLPDAYTFTVDDQGSHPFSGGFTLMTPGDQTLTVTDAAGGFSASVPVTVNDGSALGRQTGTNGVDALFESSAQAWRPEQSVDHGGRANGPDGIARADVATETLFQGPDPIGFNFWHRYLQDQLAGY